MDNQFKTIGHSVTRPDAQAKTSGAAKYTADLKPANLLHAAIVRAGKHHALIRSINLEPAKTIPGVVRIITAADIPGNPTFGSLIPDQPALAGEKIRHYGEPVALVVAGSADEAEEAARAVEIRYDDLEPVFDPKLALEDGAPRIHAGGNLNAEYHLLEGDPDNVYAESAVVIEESFSVQRISPGYMEPETSIAEWDGEVLTVWISSQQPFHDRHAIASVLGLPEETVVVKSAAIGGAFGGKEDSMQCVLAALAAFLTGRSVKVLNRRADSFYAHPKRHAAQLTYRLAADRQGRFQALSAEVYLDTGAYSSYGPAVGSQLTELASGAYFWPNVKIDTYVAHTNGPLAGAMRGFGSPQAHFALESMIDMLADELGMDPLELRQKNMLKPGARMSTRVKAGEWVNSLPEITRQVQAARKRLENIPPAAGKQAGVGFAYAMQSMGLGAKIRDDSTHRVAWQPDGTVKLYLGAPDIGQGLTAVSAQILAESLDIPFSQVQVSGMDTGLVPDGGVTCASRMTYLVGKAMITAGTELKALLLDQAAKLLDLPKDQLTYQNGRIHTIDGKVIPAEEITSRLAESDEKLETTATATFPEPPDTPQHLSVGMPHVLFVYGAQVARVEVDPDLGTVEISDLVAIHDVGKAINPTMVAGQIEGGVATGIGYALYEDVRLKANQHWVDSFTEYLLVTSEDMPARFETVILEEAEASGPYGAKGVGEICLVPTAPAISNAVARATGKRIRHLPISPEDLIEMDL